MIPALHIKVNREEQFVQVPTSIYSPMSITWNHLRSSCCWPLAEQRWDKLKVEVLVPGSGEGLPGGGDPGMFIQEEVLRQILDPLGRSYLTVEMRGTWDPPGGDDGSWTGVSEPLFWDWCSKTDQMRNLNGVHHRWTLLKNGHCRYWKVSVASILK